MSLQDPGGNGHQGLHVLDIGHIQVHLLDGGLHGLDPAERVLHILALARDRDGVAVIVLQFDV